MEIDRVVPTRAQGMALRKGLTIPNTHNYVKWASPVTVSSTGCTIILLQLVWVLCILLPLLLK